MNVTRSVRTIPLEHLAKLLALPDGTRIIGANFCAYGQYVDLVIEGQFTASHGIQIDDYGKTEGSFDGTIGWKAPAQKPEFKTIQVAYADLTSRVDTDYAVLVLDMPPQTHCVFICTWGDGTTPSTNRFDSELSQRFSLPMYPRRQVDPIKCARWLRDHMAGRFKAMQVEIIIYQCDDAKTVDDTGVDVAGVVAYVGERPNPLGLE